MPANRLSKKLFEFIKNHQKVNISKEAIRNEISRIRAVNPGITLNAAAAVFANKRGFKVNRYLNEDDRKSLQSLKQNLSTPSLPKRTPKIGVKEVNPSYGSAFIKDANENAKIYPYVYILENSLRNLILDTFSSEPAWWNNRATKNAKENAIRIKQSESKHDWLPERGNHPIYYVGLDDLFGIISKHYKTHFKHIFSDQGNLRTWINECVPIRNLLAHNVKIKRDEKQNLILRVKYICTLIDKYHKPSS